MPRDKNNEIPMEAPQSKFEEFLQQEGNKRIFFSGKYGVGKTYFLQWFFGQRKKDYDIYHLFPVRYQISSNENIVELFKYDIFAQLLEKYPKAFGSPKKYRVRYCWNSVKYYVCNIARRTLEDAKISFEVIGIPVNIRIKVVKAFGDIVKKFNLYSEGIPKEFMEKAKEECSTATDHISIFISYKIKELKGERESVLILDDFDRIDPEHIFRILNVFSVHMDYVDPNKFGFDRVVIVGDIDNIESIFHHKYGANTDFDGYFNKFFTVKPYIFNNNKAVSVVIPSLLERIEFANHMSRRRFPDGYTEEILTGILGEALEAKTVNLRQLLKFRDRLSVKIKFHNFGFIYPNSKLDLRNEDIDVGIQILIDFYGGEKKFVDALIKIKEEWSHNHLSHWDDKVEIYNTTACAMLRKIIFNKNKIPKESEFTEREFQDLVNMPSKSTSIQWLDKYTVDVSDKIDPEEEEETVQLKDCSGLGEQEIAFFFYDTLLEYIKRREYLS